MKSTEKWGKNVRSFAFSVCTQNSRICCCCCCLRNEKQRCILHSGRKTIHSLNNFRGSFFLRVVLTSVVLYVFFCFTMFTNQFDYVYVEQLKKTKTYTCGALYSSFISFFFSFHRVQHHSSCYLIFTCATLWLGCVRVYVVLCIPCSSTNYIHVLLCNSVNALHSVVQPSLVRIFVCS